MLKRIHVNMHIIRRNRVETRHDPPLTVKTSRGTARAMRISIDGPCEIVYRPTKPLACGARVWIETGSPVTIYNEGGISQLP